MGTRIFNGLKAGRKIDGWTLVAHPLGGFSILNGDATCGVVEISDFPQYRAGLCATIKMPILTKNGWHWDSSCDSGLHASVRSAVKWAITHNSTQKVGEGSGVFAGFLVVNPENSW
jgi:hypothetical protein